MTIYVHTYFSFLYENFLTVNNECFVFLSGLRINGHSKHRSGHGYESSSMLSSDLETTSFLESEDDASSRITTTTGRATNLSVDRQTLGTGINICNEHCMGKQYEAESYIISSFLCLYYMVLMTASKFSLDFVTHTYLNVKNSIFFWPHFILLDLSYLGIHWTIQCSFFLYFIF